MSHACHEHGCAATDAARTPAYRRVLWFALIVNLVMFVVEVGAGWQAGSSALLADAVDFFGDAANYGVSLAVLGLSLRWRAGTALLKGVSMGLFGIGVLAHAAWRAASGDTPEPITMGVVGTLALVANVAVAAALYRWREGDANMRSVWLCSRNDALGNLAVLAAALGVAGTGTRWPDLAVAAVMGLLALSASAAVLRQARGEWRQAGDGLPSLGGH